MRRHRCQTCSPDIGVKNARHIPYIAYSDVPHAIPSNIPPRGALSKMFSLDDVAKSGIVVLPCGAGKTLVGIAACCRVGRRALVLTTTAVAVDQWRRQLQLYTTLPPDALLHFYHAV